MFRNSDIFIKRGNFLLIRRDSILEVLEVRLAREEDTDDLAAIADVQTEISKEQFGAFFINELIASQDAGKVCLVAENAKKRVVGVIVVSDQVDYNALADCYELDEFNYFTKLDFYENVKNQGLIAQEIEKISKDFEV